jgi:hypothetical protein
VLGHGHGVMCVFAKGGACSLGETEAHGLAWETACLLCCSVIKGSNHWGITLGLVRYFCSSCAVQGPIRPPIWLRRWLECRKQLGVLSFVVALAHVMVGDKSDSSHCRGSRAWVAFQGMQQPFAAMCT